MYFLETRHYKALRGRNPKKGYRHANTRCLLTQTRRYITVDYLRRVYKLSINRLAQVIGGSTRTIQKDVNASVSPIRRIGRSYRGKNSRGIINSKGSLLTWEILSKRVMYYINGCLQTIFEVTGDDPP